jgi:hypothetical protein
VSTEIYHVIVSGNVRGTAFFPRKLYCSPRRTVVDLTVTPTLTCARPGQSTLTVSIVKGVMIILATSIVTLSKEDVGF